MNKKTIVTVSGIRPDFIRMSSVFELLDKHFNHILIHTGQHYDKMLSDVFFNELQIRKPDYNLHIGEEGKQHYHQVGDLSVKLIELLKEKNINPALILFLGDSNSVACSISLKKEGYKIGHIEAGMRSNDKRMLEEINRTVCDHCSDLHFVYHDDYKNNLLREGISESGIFVVGNTIIEPCILNSASVVYKPKESNQIILDIHRPENFKSKERLHNILQYAHSCSRRYKLPVKMLKFGRTISALQEYNLNKLSNFNIELIELMSYKTYLREQYHSLFVITDSGTGQEEPALLGTKAIIPRDYTERPQSVRGGCSFMLNVNNTNNFSWDQSFQFIESTDKVNTDWLGKGNTAREIIDAMLNNL